VTATITQRLIVTEPSSLLSAQSPFLSHFDAVKPLLNRVQSDALGRTQSEASILKVYSLKRYAACVPKVDVRSDLPFVWTFFG
jgi:hypothetical protein